MRNIDLIFVIAFGIALGSILGKVWSVTPSGLAVYQATLICVVWLVLRTALYYLQVLGRLIARQPFMSLNFWFAGHKGPPKHTTVQQPQQPPRPAATHHSHPSETHPRSNVDELLKNLSRI